MTEELVYLRALREFRTFTEADLIDTTSEEIIDYFCQQVLTNEGYRHKVVEAWEDALAEKPQLALILLQQGD